MAAGGSTKAIVTAMAANGGIAVAKFVAYLVTGSASMLAESIHSVADTSNQGLLLLGGKRAQKVADDKTPVRLRTGTLLLGLCGGDGPIRTWRIVLHI